MVWTIRSYVMADLFFSLSRTILLGVFRENLLGLPLWRYDHLRHSNGTHPAELGYSTNAVHVWSIGYPILANSARISSVSREQS